MKKYLYLVVVVLAFVLTACGGSAVAPAYTTKIEVTLNEFMFEPTAFVVPAGQEITAVLTNQGAVEHEYVIIKKGQTVTVPFDADDEDKVYWEKQVLPGAAETVTFTAPSEPGEYTVVCGISGHMESGMVAALTVVAP